MVTGGKKAPNNLGAEARGGAAGGRSQVPPPPSGQNIVQARNAKKQRLEEFAKENNLKPESVKKAYKRFQASDRFYTIQNTEYNFFLMQCRNNPYVDFVSNVGTNPVFWTMLISARCCSATPPLSAKQCSGCMTTTRPDM